MAVLSYDITGTECGRERPNGVGSSKIFTQGQLSGAKLAALYTPIPLLLIF